MPNDELVVIDYKVAKLERGLDNSIVDDLEGNGRMVVTKSLEQAVNELIAEGYQPFGTPFSDEMGRAQAMVKWGKPPLRRPSNEVLTSGRKTT